MDAHNRTLLIVPSDGSPVQQLRVTDDHFRLFSTLARVSERQLLFAATGLCFVTFLLTGLVAGSMWQMYVSPPQPRDNTALLAENEVLRTTLARFTNQLQHIDGSLARIKQLNEQTQPRAGVDSQAIERSSFQSPSSDEALNEHTPEKLAESVLHLDSDAKEQEATLQVLLAFFEDQKELLSQSPTIWPTGGYVSSDFGVRFDPFTRKRKGHHGLDIANNWGAPVAAPADGIVRFAGVRGGYGKLVVIEHRYGLETRFGHLSRIDCQSGDFVRRGQIIGKVGSTGHSTGPHLHYEVRVNGIPQNPRKFILESSERDAPGNRMQELEYGVGGR